MADTNWSSSDIARLDLLISKAADLTARQEEILKKVLAGEENIGKTRISYLNEFFDIYSRNLDTIIARKASKLSDAFLILDNEANKSFAEATSELAAAERKLQEARKASKADRTNKGSGGGGGGDDGTPPNGGNNSKSNNSTPVYQTNSQEDLDKLNTVDVAAKLSQWSKFFQKNEEERRNAILNGTAALDYNLETIEQRRSEKRINLLKEHAKQAENIEKSLMDLEMLRYQTEEDLLNQTNGIRLTRMQESLNAEIKAQELINSIAAEIQYADSDILGYGKNGQEITETGEVRARESEAKDKLRAAQAFEKSINDYRARKELEARRKNNGILSKEESTRIEKEIAKKFTLEKLNDKKRIEALAKLEAEKQAKAEREKMQEGIGALTEKGKSLAERKQAWEELTRDESGDKDTGKIISAALVAMSDLAKQLEHKVDEIASYKGAIDTRLQGSGNEKSMGSYWDQLVKDMTSVGAVTPFFKQEAFANNIKGLVDRGISFDLKQRAFLMTIQDKIATTFNSFDGTMLRLIRIQQEDSTAGRLGMESALNAFLNEMYETSEYLSDVAGSVRNSLQEMESLMGGAEAAEVEYQIQKWLGSLYSVGMSQEAVNSISSALGQIAAGQIEGLTNGGAGNLLVMAANDAGLSIADMLTDGIDSSDTNKLLQSAVNYLSELSESSKDNKVVQQQLASVFGVKASDLRAASNLALPGTTNAIFGNSLTYSGMMSQLSQMAGSMGSRTSMAEMMTNVWENGMYTLAGSMASNPISYIIYKLASVVDDAAGGIALPFVNVMGYGVDLNTTVADLMRVAAVGTGLLGSMGSIVSGLTSSFSGQAMLNKLGIGASSGLTVTPRGEGGGGPGGMSGGGSQTTSGSGYVGNSSGSDVKNSTIQEAEDSKKQQMIEAKEEEEANKVDILNTTVIQIYELLNDVVKGESTFRVKVEGYGLTKASGGAGAQGGIQALNDSIGGGSGSGVGSISSGGGVNSGGVSGSIDFGGWTTA
jgi:hypothetical protein